MTVIGRLFISSVVLGTLSIKAHYIRSDLNSLDSFTFIDRFALQEVPYDELDDSLLRATWIKENIVPKFGAIHWVISFNERVTHDPVLLFFEDYDSWLSARSRRKTCKDRMALASSSIPLRTSNTSASSLNIFEQDDLLFTSSSGVRFYDQNRANGYIFFVQPKAEKPPGTRFVFMAIANCYAPESCVTGCQGPVSGLTVELTMTNGKRRSACLSRSLPPLVTSLLQHTP